MGFDESRPKGTLRVLVRVVVTITGIIAGGVMGTTVSFAWHQLGGAVFFPDASTVGDLPPAYRLVSGIAVIAFAIWGGVLGARFGRRLVNRPRFDDFVNPRD